MIDYKQNLTTDQREMYTGTIQLETLLTLINFTRTDAWTLPLSSIQQ